MLTHGKIILLFGITVTGTIVRGCRKRSESLTTAQETPIGLIALPLFGI
jgi:hypothetical protein